MISRVIWIFTALIFIDLLILLGIRRLSILAIERVYLKWLRIIHLSGIGLFLVFSIGFYLVKGDPGLDASVFRSYFVWSDTFLLLYLTKSVLAVVILFNELFFLIFRRHKNLILRFTLGLGCSLAFITAAIVVDGILNGVKRFRLREVEVVSARLPASFDGFRILQLSDVHLGSWTEEDDVLEGLALVASAKPDLILLTGDLINVNYDEALPYSDAFRKLSARYGKYAILGNHDIGDYTRRNTIDALSYNAKGLADFYRSCDIGLMRNEHVYLKKGSDSIVLLGIDNWAYKTFRRLGRLDLATQDVNDSTFAILMSHDPSHWRAEVSGKTKIDLMLAGHTHGMQLGYQCGDTRWSPISWKYPEWLGLYREGEQFLYVSAGFGFLGYSGRIGIWPEVTVITLKTQ